MKILKQTLLTLLFCSIIYLMIYVAFGQVMIDTVIALETNNTYIIIVFGGFLLAFFVAILVNLRVAEKQDQLRSFYAAIFALLITLGSIILIAYGTTIQKYPHIIQETTTTNLFQALLERSWYYLIAIPKFIGYFSVYILGDVMLLWIIVILSYSIIFSIFLYSFTKKQRW